jgi:uncharacterized protein DUF3570
MQLTRTPVAIRQGLITASCALLASGAQAADDAAPVASPAPGLWDRFDQVAHDWSLQSALAYYHEDGRVQAIEPVIDLSREEATGGSLDLNLTIDSLSGASPNGALPSRMPQTFASPSGRTLNPSANAGADRQTHLYAIAPGQLPADSNYSDLRAAAAADWQRPFSRTMRWDFSGKVSYEDDFISITGSASILRDFNEKNTTVELGVTDEEDLIAPVGGTPVAGSDYALFAKTSNKSKNGLGALAGVTQVINRHWLVQANVAADRFHGYLNDPYKIISVLDQVGDPAGYLYEERPGQRLRKSVFLENRIGWDRVSTAVSLRYMSDDWHIHSETAEGRFRWWGHERGLYWEPSLRWYRQTAANFYTPWITGPASSAAGFASADTRLAAFRAFTYGLKFGLNMEPRFHRSGSELSLRVEYYEQIVDDPRSAPPALQGLDLYPNLKAVLVQVGFSY